MSRHLGKIIDIIKNEEGFKVPKYGRDAPEGTEPYSWKELDQHFKDGNDISEQEYIDILSGEYPNLSTTWLDSYSNRMGDDGEDKDRKVGDILNQSQHNNHSVHQRLLDKALGEKDKKEYDEDGDEIDNNWEDRYFEAFGHLAKRGSLNGSQINDFIEGKYIDPEDRDYNNILKNQKISSQHLEKFVEMRPNEIGEAMDHPNFNDKSIERILDNKKVSENIDSYFIDILVSNKQEGYDGKGEKRLNQEGKLSLNPRIIHNLLENHGDKIRNQNLSVLLDHADPTFKKKWTDEKLGITGGSYGHSEPKDYSSEEDFHGDNWANWASGEGASSHVMNYLAGSRHIDDEQAEHIKRHAEEDQKYKLYHNTNIDPKHGVEMFQKWHDDDDHHGYNAEDLQAQYKHWKDEVYSIDDLDESTIEEIRQDIWDSGEYYEDAEQEFPFDTWVDNNLDSLSQDIQLSDDHLDEVSEKMHEDYDDWEGENPNFHQHSGNPDYVALNKLNDAFEDEHITAEELKAKTGVDSWDKLGLEPDDDGEVHSDDILEKLNNEFDGPETIDYSNHDNYSISEHPEYDSRFDETTNEFKRDKLSSSPYDFHEDLWEQYRESEEFMNAENEAVDNQVKYAAKEHIDALYDTSHQDTRFVPDHLHAHIPNFAELHEQNKRILSDGGHSKFFNQHIKDRDYEHHYGEDQHFYEMVRDHAEANGGKIDVGTMNKLYPAQKEKWKKVFNGKGKVTSDEISQSLDSLPKTKYDISYGKWGGNNMQNVNGKDQVIFRLDHSTDSLKPLMEDAGLYDTFKKVQSVSKQSGHPTKDNTIAWARVDTSDPEHWMIDEVQSDFGKTVTKYLKNEGADEKAGHVDKISQHHKNWRENLTNAVLKEAKKHGAQKVSTHSPESKASHTGSSKVHSVYKDSYKKVPRSMGFQPSSMEDLPLSDSGKRHFKKEDNSKHQVYEDHRDAHTHHDDLYGVFSSMANKGWGEKAQLLANKHKDLADQHRNRFESIKPDHTVRATDWASEDAYHSPENIAHAQNSIKNGDGFKHHDNDAMLDKPPTHIEDKVFSGHTFNLTPSLLKKHMDDCLEYLEALEKGEIGNAVKGGVLALSMMQGAHMMSQDSKKQATEDFAQKNAPKHARSIASVDHEHDVVEQARNDAKAEAEGIIYKNNKKWFMDNHADGLSNHVYKQTIKNDPELNQKYGYIGKLSNRSFKEVVQKNNNLRDDVHSAHYDKLHGEFDGDHEKMLHAWGNGIKSTHAKFQSRQPAEAPKLGEKQSPDIVDDTVKEAPQEPNFTSRRAFRTHK